MVSWSEHVARLDAEVFGHLADDVAAVWSRQGVFSLALPVILDVVERQTSHQGIAHFEQADVARISAADVARLRPEGPPQIGDVLTVGGVAHVVHGTAFRDERMGGRDWLCPVTR